MPKSIAIVKQKLIKNCILKINKIMNQKTYREDTKISTSSRNIPFQSAELLLSAAILLFLIFWFGTYIQPKSFDLVQHFLLVDEIMKYGTVRPPPVPNLSTMAFYPPASHWLAALIGWVGGSGLVGITIVSISSVFLMYVLIIRLISIDAPANVLLFMAAFLALGFTHSQVGWEIVTNFFYPQLVADVLYFAAIYWLSNNRDSWQQALAILGTSTLTMYIQPLVAVHILAAGFFLILFKIVELWKAKSTVAVIVKSVGFLLLVATGSILIILLHPAFKTMRMIAGNDGYLEFSYSYVMPIVAFCALIGVLNLRRRHWDNADYTDIVLGSAVVASASLALLQFLLLKFQGSGSMYAVKKHMFIILSLGVMNAVRLIGARITVSNKWNTLSRPTASIAAGIASLIILFEFNMPVAPILKAMAYANHAVDYQIPEFIPGNIVADDEAQPLIANVMISLTAFQHPFNAEAIGWQNGAKISEGSTLAMIRRTPYTDKLCAERFAATSIYMLVNPSCRKWYITNYPLTFSSNGNGLQYIVNGWAPAESWGAWTMADSPGGIELRLPPPHNQYYKLVVDGMAYINEGHVTQSIIVEVNGTEVSTWNYDKDSPAGERSALIPGHIIKNNSVRIIFKAPGAVSPFQIGKSADSRLLGIGVKTITLHD